MKKVTLLFAALLLTVVGAQANSLKTPVNLSMDWKVDGSADVTYNSKTITWADGTTGTGLGQNGLSYNVADYDRLVIKITSSTCSNVRFRMDPDNAFDVANNGWDCVYVDIPASNSATTYTINLTGNSVVCNQGTTNSAFSVIKRMWFNTLDVGNIVIDEIYFEKNYGGATAAKYNLDLSSFIGGWGENKVAATTTTLTKNTGENDGWELSNLSYVVSNYDRFVVKVSSSTLSDLHVRIANGDNFKTQDIGTVNSETTFTVDLSGSYFTADNSTTVSTITRIWFASESSEVTGSATFSAIYLEKDLTVEDALTRSNTVADKYGTICLPFAVSTLPTNATIYDVVGYSETAGSPSALYLEAVNAMEAGKAYIFKSSDTEDITFTKTGTDDNLVSPAAFWLVSHASVRFTNW